MTPMDDLIATVQALIDERRAVFATQVRRGVADSVEECASWATITLPFNTAVALLDAAALRAPTQKDKDNG